MILALDIGNTFTKTGIFDNNKLVFGNKTKTENFSPGNFKEYSLTGCAISSVVPAAADAIINLIKTKLGITPYLISHNSEFSLKIEYETPGTLGIDRICGAEGAFRLFNTKGTSLGQNDIIISIDFGTATTINLIRHPNRFIGGIIAPGVRMMFETLNKNTSQLPEADFKEYGSLIGNSTNSAIASGVINTTTGLIEQTRKFLIEKFNAENIFIFITGGNAESIMPHLDFKYEYEPNLVLQGVYSVYTKNNK